MNAYAIRLGRLEAGALKTARYIVNGRTHLDAVESVLEHTGAPRSAVMSWQLASAADIREWRKEIGNE